MTGILAHTSLHDALVEMLPQSPQYRSRFLSAGEIGSAQPIQKKTN